MATTTTTTPVQYSSSIQDDFEIHNQYENPETSKAKKYIGWGTRHSQIALLFIGLFLAYAQRVNLSIGIVAMVDNTPNPAFEEYPWNEATQGLLLSSFFWGYVVSNLPAGFFAQRYGPKIFLLGSLSVCSLMTILTPLFAGLGWEVVCASRVVQGLAQGFIYPCVHTMLSRWVHPSERAFLSTFTYSGTQLGTVLMLATSGIIADSSLGWPAIFYLSGGLAAIWAVFWAWLGCNSPMESTTISPNEKNFIQSNQHCSTSTEKRTTPWSSIFLSVPFLAILVTHSAQNWGFWTLLTEIPRYMKNVLEFDIKQNALLSAMPYFVMWLLSILFSRASDSLTNRHLITNATARKTFNSIGHWLPAITLIALAYVPKDQDTVAVALLTLSVGLNSAAHVGYLINHMDLSPNFAGVMIGITNGVSNIMSILGPLLVGFVVTDATDGNLWRIVFFVAAGIFFVGNLIFVVFGSATIQPWNDVELTAVTKSSTSTLEMRKKSTNSRDD